MQAINLKRVAQVIGLLVDQISDDDLHHSRRIALMAWRVARRLNLPKEDLDDILIGALIHDCGIDSPREYLTIVTNLHWDNEYDHCHRGGEYVGNCTLLKRFSNIVRHHHTPWYRLVDEPISEMEKIKANIIFCVDRGYVGFHSVGQMVGNDSLINHKQDICAPLMTLERGAVSPDILSAFLDVARTDGFWISLNSDFLDSTLSPLNRDIGEDYPITFSQMRNVGTLISRLVDVKSHFTHEHSERVGIISSHLAERLGLDDETIRQLELAALLHDVGKQQAPESVLLKPGSLDDRERAIIKRHTIGTEMILSLLFNDSQVVRWASNHHEKLDGSGYPYGLMAGDLDICSRILTMADIFQALTQERPYRGRMRAMDAVSVVQSMVDKGELDREVFQVVKSDPDFIYELSTQ